MNRIVIDVVDFKLSSVNQRTIPIVRGGKSFQVPDPAYNKCKNDLIKIFQSKTPYDFKMLERDILVMVKIFTSKDLDNCLKLIIDALQGAEIIKDDSEVMQIEARKVKIKRGRPETIEITVVGFSEESLFDDSELRGEVPVSKMDSGR